MWKMLIRAAKSKLIRWLDERALRLSDNDKRALAALLKVEPEVIERVEQHIRMWVIERVREL